MNTRLATRIALVFALGLAACEEPSAAPHGAEPRPAPAATAPTPTPAATEPTPAEATPAPTDPLDCGPVLASQQRGIAYAHSTRQGGYGSDASQDSLEELSGLGVDWITITPFGWMAGTDATEVVMNTTGRGESDASLRAVTAQAQALDIHVVMKPHLWMRGGAWRGDIGFADEAGWDAWFASYTRFIVHYAELSEELGLDLLVVGVELRSSTATHPDRWREVIRAVRAVYSGPITYAANWDEAEYVTFWDAVDYIGIQMFAPLATQPGASREALVARADHYLRHYTRIAKAFDRPLLLTEVGFRSVIGTAVDPWTWPSRGDDSPATPDDEAAQATAYCAIIQTFGQSERVAGMYWWKWFSNTERSDGPTGFSPRGKPALVVLRNAFQRG